MLCIFVALCCSDSLRVQPTGWSGFVVAVVTAETVECVRNTPRDGVPECEQGRKRSRRDGGPRARSLFTRRNHFSTIAAKAHALLLRVGVYLFARAKYV